MPRPPKKKMPRTHIPDEPSTDGSYHAFVPTGRRLPNGKPERRHLQDRDRDNLIDKALKLEELIDAGKTPAIGAANLKASAWFTTWLTEHAPKRGGYKTLENRRWAVNTYLIPHLGNYLLAELDTSYIEDMYFKLYDEGLSPKSIELIHEAAVLALNKAVGKKYIPENPATGAERPEAEIDDIEPPTAAEITALLRAIMARPDRCRWLTQFLGPRQGETLGLMVDDFELDEQIINVRGKLQRRTYRHGCTDPVACARPHCKTEPCRGNWQHGCKDPEQCAKPHCQRAGYPSTAQYRTSGILTTCPEGCTGHARACPKRYAGKCHRHTRPCPSPCKRGCTKHASHCPNRIGGLVLFEPEHAAGNGREHKEVARPRRTGSRRETGRTKRLKPKSRAGKRRFGIPDLFMPAFVEHFEELRERERYLGDKWRGVGLAFCGPFGEPIDPRKDYDTWCEILDAAGVEHMPVHWIRHIAATVLLAARVDSTVVMSIMGWSDPRMLQRYQHVADDLRRDAANRLASVLANGGATAGATAPVWGSYFQAIEKGPESQVLPAHGAL